mgnify:CR=1 FL=1
MYINVSNLLVFVSICILYRTLWSHNTFNVGATYQYIQSFFFPKKLLPIFQVFGFLDTSTQERAFNAANFFVKLVNHFVWLSFSITKHASHTFMYLSWVNIDMLNYVDHKNILTTLFPWNMFYNKLLSIKQTSKSHGLKGGSLTH